jgi:hypothetical protein
LLHAVAKEKQQWSTTVHINIKYTPTTAHTNNSTHQQQHTPTTIHIIIKVHE